MTIRFDPPPLPLEGPVSIPALRAWLDQGKIALESVRLEPVPPASGALIFTGTENHIARGTVARLPAACLSRTAQLDVLIAALLQRARAKTTAAATPPALLICALGSYGRRELCPHSDIDLLFLHEPGADTERLKGLLNLLLTPLWDCGLTATQVVYTPADVALLARQLAAADDTDPATVALQKQWTSLLSARAIDGIPLTPPVLALASELARIGATFQRDHGFSFARHKAREIIERHAALHIRPWEIPSPEYLEPNLKEGLGGLRDGLAADFIDGALGDLALASSASRATAATSSAAGESASASPAARADAGADSSRGWLLAARCLLHTSAGHAQERLVQGLQPEVLERLLMQLQPEPWFDEPADRLHAGMTHIYAALRRVHAHAISACRRVAEGPRQGRTPTARQRLERQTVSEHFSRVGGELHPTTAGEKALRGADAITVALEGCELALQESLAPGAAWGETLCARLTWAGTSSTGTTGAVTATHVPGTAAMELFRRILAHPAGIYELFMWMHSARLLGALMPEFAGITDRTQRAPLHEVTVDVHTLRVLGALENWRHSTRAEDRERVASLNALPRRDLLRLAALLHDIGKSRGDAGHPERGSLMAHDVLTRLGYPPEDIRLVRILIEEHLALFNLTTLDPTDRGPFERLAQRLEQPAMIDQLYLLTIADAQGVAVGALPLWREDRLRSLWLKLHAAATGQSPRAPRGHAPESPGGAQGSSTPAKSLDPAEALRDTLLRALPDPARRRGPARLAALQLRRRMELHLKAMPARYLTRVSAEAALAHVHLIERLGRHPAAVETRLTGAPKPHPPRRDSGRYRVRQKQSARLRAVAAARSGLPAPVTHATEAAGHLSIVTRDRPGRFSQICAGLSGAGLTVIAAEVYERADGLIIDEFRVMPAPAFAAGVPPEQLHKHLADLLAQAAALILEILKTPARAAEVMARMRAHPLHAAPRAPGASRYDAEVTLMDASHEPLTIVDVRCADRAGLLYALTRAIADLGLNIHFATIDTVRGTATDVFYLSEADGSNLRDIERKQNLRLLLKSVADPVA